MADSYRENVLSLLENKQSVVNFDSLYHMYEYHQLFATKKPGMLTDVISSIQIRLNSSKQRLEGLVLLDALVRQCTGEVFSDNVAPWIELLLKLLQTHNDASVQRLVCLVTKSILRTVPTFPEISREVATNTIPHLLSALLSASHEWIDGAISCINSCIQNFPGACGPFKMKIETLIINKLDQRHVGKLMCRLSQSLKLVLASLPKEVVDCYALLAGCGGSGGQRGLKYTEAWTIQCNKVLASLSITIGQLYTDIETDAITLISSEEFLTLSSLGDMELELLAGRYEVLCSCLESLLSEEFPAVAQVPVSSLIQLICRTLSVNNKMLLSRPTTGRIFLATFLPSIHHSALSLLKSLIMSCKKLLVPYSTVVLNLLVQELQWTQPSTTSSATKHYGQLRQAVNETLALWLKVTGAVSDVKVEGSALVKSILSDIVPSTDRLKIKSNTLQQKAGPPPRKKKKGGRGGYQDMSNQLVGQKKIDGGADRLLAISALDALYWLVTAVGTCVTGDTLKDIQGSVIGTILEIQRSRYDIAFPYTDPECRKALYKALLACVITPHPTGPNLSQCALTLLRTGLQDPNVSVASYCTEALVVCELLIHPRAPCLQSPVICDVETNVSIPCPFSQTGSKPCSEPGNQPKNPFSDPSQNSNEPQSPSSRNNAAVDIPILPESSHVQDTSPNTEAEASVGMDVDNSVEDENSDSDSDTNLSTENIDMVPVTKQPSHVVEIVSDSVTTNIDRHHAEVTNKQRPEQLEDLSKSSSVTIDVGKVNTLSQDHTPSSVSHISSFGQKEANAFDTQTKATILDFGNSLKGEMDSTLKQTETPVTSQQLEITEEQSTQCKENGEDKDVAAMLMTFVNADPDSN